MAVENEKGAVNRTADRAGDIAGREGMHSRCWEEVFRGGHQPILILDPDHVILEANRVVQEATGLSEEELRGKKCYQIFHGADEPPPDCPLAAMLSSGRPEESEMDVEILRRTFFVSVTPLFDDHGRLERIVHVGTDITERKRAEDLIRAQRDLVLKLGAEAGLDETLRLCVEAAIQSTGMDAGGIYLVDGVSGDLNLAFSKGLSPDFVEATSHFSADSPSARLVTAGQPIYEDFQALDVPMDEIMSREGLRVIAILPVHHEGRVIACLNISSHFLDEMPTPTRNALETIAAEVGSFVARARAEEALAHERDLLQALMDNMPDTIYFKDTASRFTRINKAQAQVLGVRDPQEVIGKTDSDFFTDEHAQAAYADEQKMVETGKALIAKEEKVRRADGTFRWVSSTKVPIKDAAGHVTGIVGISRDITEHKGVTDAFRESEERYRTMIENANDMIWMMDTEGRFTISNHQAEITSGYELEEWKGKSFAPLIHQDDLEMVSEVFRKTLSGESQHYTVRCYKKSGEMFILSVNTTPVYEKGKVIGTLSFGRDITERKLAEGALRESEEQYRITLDSMDSCIHVIDEDFKIILFNKAFEQFNKKLGLITDVLGLPLPEAFPFLTENVYDEYRRVFENGETIVTEDNYKFESEDVFTECHKIPVVKSGKVETVVTILRDVTEHKRLVAQLLQAQKMEAVGHLAGGVAHDFNNILAVILGYVQISQKHLSPDDELFQNLQQIREAGEKATVLIRQLLAFSRRQIMQPNDLDINEVVDGLLLMIRRVIAEDIDLQFISGRQLGTVHADPGQIEQVLMNLCVNARDAMSQGGALTIETENVLINGAYRKTHPWASEGRYVLLSVTDTGHGMSEETRRQIFEPFFTTKEVGKGTGLGLSMVYGIVKQHNGMVDVSSEAGKGTTFKIYLPLVEGGAAEIGSNIEGLVRGGTETLLFAEDDELLREMTVEVLETAGYRALVATDGREAVDMFEAHAEEISLVLLDVVMPKLSGRDACDRIREINPDVRTLFTSGYSANAIHTRFVLDEGIEVIQKPYDTQVLLRKIREVLDRK